MPLYDNDSPFSNESYFDGSRVRTIPSGKELNEIILNQIGIKREDCWITDLVKVFLFKEGHVRRYEELGKKDIQSNRNKFKDYAIASTPWLLREIEIAHPKVVILLGAEVISVLFKTSQERAIKLMDGDKHELPIENMIVTTICLPHPGILMQPSARNPWPERFKNEIAPRVKEEISKIN